MHELSRLLGDLYDIAQHASLKDFPSEVLRILRSSINFDGAVIGMGEADTGLNTDLRITQAHVYNRASSLLDDYAQVSAMDPVTNIFVGGLTRPLRVDCCALYSQKQLLELNEFARRHDLSHLLLYGNRPAVDGQARWIVLYHGTRQEFTAAETERLHLIWPHLSRAINTNRFWILDQRDSGRARRASALVNRHGVIEAADPNFFVLLRRQWPACDQKRLPKPAMDCLAQGRVYRGKHVEIDMAQEADYLVCDAKAVDTLAALSPKEYSVARRFASGMNYKDIARELGVSQYTVRNQLARLYDKLDVHDKAALAQYLMANMQSSGNGFSAEC